MNRNWFAQAKFVLLALLTNLYFLNVASAQGNDWYNLDLEKDGVMGVSANRALEYLEGKVVLKPVIVAVIDDGVDINHPDFEGRIWLNTGEVSEDGIDNEGNGYIDDLYGWNFLGNPKGENIEFETLEITRQLREMAPLFDGKSEKDFKGKDRKAFNQYTDLQAQYDAEVEEIREEFSQFSQLTALYSGALAFARERIGRDELSMDQLRNFEPANDSEQQVIEFLLMAEIQGLRSYIEEGAEYFESALNYHYNLDFNPRHIVNTASSTAYGNQMVWAANPNHGTHVAGIIAAVRDNEIGVDGIAPNAIILPIRAVPGGDERDEDVAAAIRYAVDQGARIINMSFGKGISPNEPLVHEAILYARSKDVLMIHAAGNDLSNNDKVANYPDGTLGKKKSLDNWITVAASGPEVGGELLANFSNYGKNKVDVLAPGVDILSLKPEGVTAVNSGTSMAAPVVSGVAALILGINPELTAKQVKDIILRTVHMHSDINIPFDDSGVKLKKLLRTPGVVSAYEASKYTYESYKSQ